VRDGPTATSATASGHLPGRGLATWALPSVLVRTPALGLRKVLVTCGDSNLASARVIEKAGGVRETELGLTRHYWITP
jgi:predicted acetyltransferase